MVMSLRKVASELAASPWKLFTLLAHSSKVVSCVTPASSAMASYFVLPGIWCGPLESPPSYQGVTSVVRFKAPHLLRPATYWPSHLILNLKPMKGSNRLLLTVNLGMDDSPLRMRCHQAEACRAGWRGVNS